MHGAQAVVGPDALEWPGLGLRNAKAFATPGDRLRILTEVAETEGQPGATGDRWHEAASPAEPFVERQVLQRFRDPAQAIDRGPVVALADIHTRESDADPGLEAPVAERGGDGEGAEPRLRCALEVALMAQQVGHASVDLREATAVFEAHSEAFSHDKTLLGALELSDQGEGVRQIEPQLGRLLAGLPTLRKVRGSGQ